MTSQKETILSECADMIRSNETEKLQLMFKLMDRVPDEGITPMLNDLETHIRASGIADMVRYQHYVWDQEGGVMAHLVIRQKCDFFAIIGFLYSTRPPFLLISFYFSGK